MRKSVTSMSILAAAVTLAACGKSPGESEAAGQPQGAAAQTSSAKPEAGGDPCSLVADTSGTFGQPVTAAQASVGKAISCEWKNAEGRICGLVTVYGPGWNDGADSKTQFTGMAASLGAFGQPQEVAGLGDEAKAVDGGLLGAQLAFRKGDVSALIASSCDSASLPKTALAEKLAREVAERL